MGVIYDGFYDKLLSTGDGKLVVVNGNQYVRLVNRGIRRVAPDVRYKVFITPRVSRDEYAPDALDVTEYVLKQSITEIYQEVDNSDFDVGRFSFGNVSISLINTEGYFYDERMSRTLFGWARDLCKVEVRFYDEDGNETAEFRGFVQEDHTVDDVEKQTTKLSVLSRDSIFRKVYIRGGQIPAGATATEAFEIILNRPDVTRFLTYSSGLITPPVNPVIGSATLFDDTSAVAAIDALCVACGAVFYVDDSDRIIVTDRERNTNTPFVFYGAGDLLGRGNIIRLNGLRYGLNRAFNKVTAGDVTAQDINHIDRYGLKEKELPIKDYITDLTQQEAVALYYLEEFRTPRRECVITVPTNDALDVRIFDTVKVDYPKLQRPVPSRPSKTGIIASTGSAYIGATRLKNEAKFSIYGKATYGTAKYSFDLSELKINANIAWKVIGKRQNISGMTTDLKLREVGKAPGEEFI